MKKLSASIILIFLIALSCGDSTIVKPPSTVQHGWVVQAPELGINQFYSVDFVDDNNGWIVGSHGTILHTTNGGMSWEQQESNTEESLIRVFFVNSNHGWICNLDGSIFHTSDGGQNWNLQYSEEKLGLYNIFFSDEKHGWAVGRGYIDDSANYGGIMLATTDGGDTWFDLIRDDIISGLLTGVYFIDSVKGWIASGGIRGTFRTEDGGHTWQPLETLSGSLNDIIFFNDTVGFTYAVTAAVLKTSDGGIFWDQLPVITNGRWLQDMEFVNEQNGWIVGEKGYISHTADGGDSWNNQESGTDNMLRSASFTDENKGWAVGKGATIIHTNDGGSTWNSKVKPTKKALGDISMVTKSIGCATGLQGTILTTINGGLTWEKQNNASLQSIYGLATPSLHNWIAVGDSGTILQSTNQGLSWNSISPNLDVHYRDIYFLDDSRGWIVGKNKILRTENGGTNWSIDSLELAINDHLNSTFFVDSINGWVTTYLGKIYITINAGESWTEQIYSGDANFSDIYFITKNHGFVVGRSLALYETKDGGNTWEWIYLNTGGMDTYNSIHFTDSLNGWIVGEDFTGLNGVIYKTTDGGTTWNLTTKAIENPLYSVYAVDKNHVWICGENGTILHTNDGGSGF